MKITDDADLDSIPVPKELKPQPEKWLALAITGILTAIGAALLHWFGDSVFNKLVAILGKRLLLQSGLVLLCSLGYCIYLIVATKRRKLEWKRALYWAKDDSTPFCAHCYDNDKKRIHLISKKHFDGNQNVEWWACYVCNHDFAARNGENFAMSIVRQRLR